MKTHLLGKIGKVKDRSLEPYRLLSVGKNFQFRHRLFPAFVVTGDNLQFQPFTQPFDNRFGKRAVGNDRQTVEFEKREIGKREPSRQAESHRFAERKAVVGEKIGHNAGFTVGGMAVRVGRSGFTHRGFLFARKSETPAED